MLLPVIFLVILFLLSWTVVMAHPEHLRAQGTAWGTERGTELQCFLPREGLSYQEGLVRCLENLCCLWGRRYSNKSSLPSCSVCAAPSGPSRA